MSAAGFLAEPELTPAGQALFDADTDELGYVMNATRVWAYQPSTLGGLFEVMRQAISAERLSFRERGILVAAGVSAMGDAYCSLAWGRKLATVSDAQTAAGVLRGDDGALSPAERAMAGWARRLARDPSGTNPSDVQVLRDAGLSDERIFAITVFVALRIAFSTVNDALGALPDAEFRDRVPAEVLAAVTFGRPLESTVD